MARRAQQGAVAHCPWCAASLPHLAAECPECRFPLTMAAAEGGFRAAGTSGTTSTASSAASGPAPAAPGSRYDPTRPRVHGDRAHRMRIVAWLLGLSALLLLLAGVGTIVSSSSPGAQSDREAKASLATALHRATDDPAYRQEAVVTTVSGDQPSDRATQISSDQAQGFWFGAAHSASGRCFLLAARAADATLLGGGTLGDNEPCSAARVRFHLEDRLVTAEKR